MLTGRFRDPEISPQHAQDDGFFDVRAPDFSLLSHSDLQSARPSHHKGQVLEVISGALPLAQTKHTPLLGQLFGTCVRQSESTDQLVRSLHDLATYYDREAHLTHTVQRRLSLPLMVLGISLLTCILIPLFVLPTASSLLP